MRTRLSVLVVVLCLARLAGAQNPTIPANRDRAVAAVATPIMFDALNTRPPLRMAAIGTSFLLVHELGDWLEVEYLDPQFGLRTGFVRAANVKIQRAAALQPIDLSVPRENKAPPPIAPPQPIVAAPLPTSAERATPNRVFLDTDFMVFFPQQDALTLTANRALNGSSLSGTFRASYAALPRSQNWFPSPTVRLMFGHRFAVGARFLMRAYEVHPGLFVQIPVPLQNRTAIDSDIGAALDRKDWMLDFNLQYVANSAKARYVVFGGPSLFHTDTDLVRTIAYTQSAAGIVNITGSSASTLSGKAWGVNVGGDASYFAWRHVGFGAGATWNNGQITVTDPLSRNATDLTVGAMSVTFGPRFRF